MEEKIVQFKGTIVRCVCDKDNFKVYAANVDQNEYPDVQINKYKNVSITGDLPDLVFDVEYEITAQEKQTKYGISYYVLNIRRDIPTTQEDVYEFLREILTENQATTLIQTYPDIIDRVREDRLNDIDFSKLRYINEKKFEEIKEKIICNFHLMDLVKEFKNVLSLSILKKIYKEFSSVDVLREKLKSEPYSTLTKISGIGFKIADSIIIKLQNDNIIDFGYDVKTSADRCLACLVYCLEENENNGDTKANIQDIRSKCLKFIPECINHFVDVIKDDNIYYDKENMYIALNKTYKNEKYIANSIKYGLSVNNKWDFDWKQYQNKGKYNLSDEQIELLHCVCENNIVIMSGSAGSGKSSSTEMLIQMLRDNNKTFLLATPTAKSAKVLQGFSNVMAQTIHRALGYNPQFGWLYCKNNKLDCDVLLLDEVSMISVDLMSHIIDAIDFNKTKLIMIGDPNQLPSIQAGNLLYDFLMSNKIPVVKLTKIFRYGHGGILTVATDINSNKKYIPNNNNKVIVFGDDDGYTLVKSNDDTIVKEAVALYERIITNGINGNIYEPKDIAVLSAYNKGNYGTVILNNYLQKIANKNYGSENCIKCGKFTYYIGDIVMQCVNDYHVPIYNYNNLCDEGDAMVANGETGIVTYIGKDFMVVKFGDLQLKYSKDVMNNLSLAYSYSVHKSQGSTIKIVIVITPRSHIYMNNANLLYVGITRSSDKCFHFGLPSTINIAMKKKENFNRLTFMQELLMN